jgi:hypothetical protein
VILAKSRGVNHIGQTNAHSLKKEMKTPWRHLKIYNPP